MKGGLNYNYTVTHYQDQTRALSLETLPLEGEKVEGEKVGGRESWGEGWAELYHTVTHHQYLSLNTLPLEGEKVGLETPLALEGEGEKVGMKSGLNRAIGS